MIQRFAGLLHKLGILFDCFLYLGLFDCGFIEDVVVGESLLPLLPIERGG